MYCANESVFQYVDTVIASSYPYFQPNHILKNISKNVAVSRLSSDDMSHMKVVPSESLPGVNDTYLYYSGNIRLPTFTKLVEAVNLKDLIDDELYDIITVLVWIGNKGVAASPHYDNVNNIYIQLHGSKTFFIWPPSMELSGALKLFGRNHPNACQSRLRHLNCSAINSSTAAPSSLWFHHNFRTIDLYASSNISSHLYHTSHFINQNWCDQSDADAIVITLHPGDVLYLPAFWFHEVRLFSI